MKKSLLSILFLLLIATTAQAQIVNIPDAKFKKRLLTYIPKIDLNSDGQIQVSEAQMVTKLFVEDRNIANLTGIEAFTALTQLNCSGIRLTTLDVTKNTALTLLHCNFNSLTTLDVTNNTALVDLECDINSLTTLDVTNNTALNWLYCNDNPTLSIICLTPTQLGLTVSDARYWKKYASATWSTTCTNGIEALKH